MRGRVTWLFVLALGAGPWAWGQQELPRPKPLPDQKKPAPIDPADKDAPDKGKDKDKDKDVPDKGKDDQPPNGKAPAEPDTPTVPPIYYSLDPFPPSSPPVMDPRTGGWEQVQGGHYMMVYQPNLPCGHLPAAVRPVTDTPPTPPPQPKVPVRADVAGPLQQVGWKAPAGRTIRLVRDARTGAWVIGEVKP
jgi:hypothetical protein